MPWPRPPFDIDPNWVYGCKQQINVAEVLNSGELPRMIEDLHSVIDEYEQQGRCIDPEGCRQLVTSGII